MKILLHFNGLEEFVRKRKTVFGLCTREVYSKCKMG